MKKRFQICILFLLTLLSSSVYGQIPVITTPQPTNMPTLPTYTPNTNNNPTVPNYSTPNSKNPLDIYEQDRRTIERRDAEVKKTLNQYNVGRRGIQYNIPSKADKQSAESYRKAAKLLNNMLNGTIPISLKDAVFTVDNTFTRGNLDYSKYNKAIQTLVTTAKLATKQDGYNWNDPVTRNAMLFRVMSDTLKIKTPNKESTITSYPMRYNYDDYNGAKDWMSMSVSKLLATQKGQCHSMPLLYLIMCEATNTEASLAYSPRHSYVKFKDETGKWYNLELTNGFITSDALIIGSGFITADALKSKIYMEPQTKKEVIAECLNDLASNYVHDYGYDGFALQCADSALKYAPNSLRSMSMKANCMTDKFEYVVNQVGRPHPDSLRVHYPKIYKILEERNKTYRWLDECGYRDMPEEAYNKWLNFIGREKEKQEKQDKTRFLIQSTK